MEQPRGPAKLGTIGGQFSRKVPAFLRPFPTLGRLPCCPMDRSDSDLRAGLYTIKPLTHYFMGQLPGPVIREYVGKQWRATPTARETWSMPKATQSPPPRPFAKVLPKCYLSNNAVEAVAKDAQSVSLRRCPLELLAEQTNYSDLYSYVCYLPLWPPSPYNEPARVG